MKINAITIYLAILTIFTQLNVFAQTHTIFLDDTTFYTKKYRFHLKDSLSDGMWILHNLHRKDSTKISERTLLTTGNFKEHKREGVFNYYTEGIPVKGKKKEEHYVWYSETYKSNLLEGMVARRTLYINMQDRETMYKEGVKKGLDILYYIKGKKREDIACINYFNNDTLLYQIEYKHDKFISATLMYMGKNEYMHIVYDIKGQIKYISLFKNYQLYKQQKFHPNQVMEKESDGDFQYSIEDYVATRTDSYNTYYFGLRGYDSVNLMKGIERIYDKNGKLIEERIIDKEDEKTKE